MDIDYILAEITAKQNDLLNLQRKYIEQFKIEFYNIVKKYFDVYPELGAICWTQYTPYFNDGEECVFRVHGVSIAHITCMDDLSELTYDDIWPDEEKVFVRTARYKSWGNGHESYDIYDYKPHIKKLKESIEQLVHGNESVIQKMFGDHVRVLITRSGIDIEEYEHE